MLASIASIQPTIPFVLQMNDYLNIPVRITSFTDINKKIVDN